LFAELKEEEEEEEDEEEEEEEEEETEEEEAERENGYPFEVCHTVPFDSRNGG
jgi:hypothetical protein